MNARLVAFGAVTLNVFGVNVLNVKQKIIIIIMPTSCSPEHLLE